MHEMHANETNGQATPHPADDKHIQISHGTRRHLTNGYRPVRRTIKRIHVFSHSHGHILTLLIYILCHQNRCEDMRKGASRHHDTPRVLDHNHHIITDKRTQFMSEKIADTTRVLGIQLRHATTKHAQTIGTLERCHASLKESLKISTGERRRMWHQFIPTATLNYNTTYNSALGCEPIRVFHSRVPYNVLDLKFGLKQGQSKDPTTDAGEEVVQKTRMLHDSANTCYIRKYSTNSTMTGKPQLAPSSKRLLLRPTPPDKQPRI